VFEIVNKNPTWAYSTPDGDITLKREADFLQDLSEKRARAVRASIVKYSRGHNLILEESQLRDKGVGAHEPSEGPSNRRVEFRIVKVPEGKVNLEEFDLEK